MRAKFLEDAKGKLTPLNSTTAVKIGFPLLVTISEQIHDRISRRKPESVAALVMY
jgi:hypothetical protein